jgi:hypothetical protein
MSHQFAIQCSEWAPVSTETIVELKDSEYIKFVNDET